MFNPLPGIPTIAWWIVAIVMVGVGLAVGLGRARRVDHVASPAFLYSAATSAARSGTCWADVFLSTRAVPSWCGTRTKGTRGSCRRR